MNKSIYIFFWQVCICFIAPNAIAQSRELDSLQEALKTVRVDSLRLEIHQRIANANLYFKNNYPEALKNYFITLKISEDIGNKEKIGSAYGNIGEVYRLQGNYPLALKYYLAALKIFETTGHKKYIANSCNNIGLIYVELRNFKEALKKYFQALEIRKEINDIHGLASIYNNIGIIHDNQKNYDEALKNYFSALALNKKANYKPGITICYLNIGELNTLLKRHSEALFYLNKGLALAKEIKFSGFVKEAYIALSELYSLQGKWEQAFQYYKLYTSAKDSILNIESTRLVTEMQARYETEKKEKENALLIKENKIKTLELKQNEQQRNLLIGSLMLILLLGGLLYNHYRLKHRNKLLQERELRANAIFQAQEEEKIRISKELHDGVGPLLSLIKLNISSLETNEGNQKIITKTKELASESIKEVRNISHTLMPGLLARSGLKAALEELLEQVSAGKLNATLDFSISSTLKPEAEINIYRIVQEAVNNILKHSGANSAKIQVEEQDQYLRLFIIDNGCGFDSNGLTSGNGLNNIYSRTDFMGGKLAIASAPGKGCNLKIQIPITKIKHASNKVIIG